MKRLITIMLFLLAGCHITDHHPGPHRMDLVDSFEANGETHYIFQCYKDCPHRDTFPPTHLH